MSRKKSTAKGSSAPTARAGDASLRELAEHLSAIINHPDAPVEFVNHVIAAFCDLEARASKTHSADFIFAVLKENKEVR